MHARRATFCMPITTGSRFGLDPFPARLRGVRIAAANDGHGAIRPATSVVVLVGAPADGDPVLDRMVPIEMMATMVEPVVEPPMQTIAETVVGRMMVAAVQTEAEAVVVVEAEVQAVAPAVVGGIVPPMQSMPPMLAILMMVPEPVVTAKVPGVRPVVDTVTVVRSAVLADRRGGGQQEQGDGGQQAGDDPSVAASKEMRHGVTSRPRQSEGGEDPSLQDNPA